MNDFEITGLDELQEDFKKALKAYPDKAYDTLEDTGKQFKKRVVQITREAVDQHTGKLIKGFKLDKMQGYGSNMQKNFRGTAPHFHLIENGHDQATKDGQTIGFVPGRLIVDQARKEYSVKMPQIMSKMCDEILKRSDLK